MILRSLARTPRTLEKRSCFDPHCGQETKAIFNPGTASVFVWGRLLTWVGQTIDFWRLPLLSTTWQTTKIDRLPHLGSQPALPNLLISSQTETLSKLDAVLRVT